MGILRGAGQPRKGEPKAKAKAGAQAKGVTEEGSAGTVSGRPSADGPASVSQETLLAEAAKLLKGGSLKAVHVEAGDIGASWLLSVIESASDSSFALIDSGATNALRPATKEELQVIRVDLASGTAELRVNQCADSSTVQFRMQLQEVFVCLGERRYPFTDSPSEDEEIEERPHRPPVGDRLGRRVHLRDRFLLWFL